MLQFGLSAGMSGSDTAIQKKIYESGCPLDLASRTIGLIISNEEIKDIIKKVKLFEESGLLTQGISETI